MLEGSNGTDRYSFEPRTSLGSADYLGYGLFIDEGGNDQHTMQPDLDRSSDHSLEGLFDLGGTDSYSLPQE